MKRVIFGTAFLLAFLNLNAQEYYLVKSGRPLGVIQPVINDSLIEVVDLFNKYVKQITGTELEMKPWEGGFQIDFHKVSGEELIHHPYLSGIKDKDVRNEAFEIYQDYSGIGFYATSVKGLKNAVYSFMEKNAGVRFYTHDAVIVPKSSSFSVTDNEWFDSPAFTFRTPYYYEATFQDYIDFHKITASPKDTEKPSWPVSNDWGLWVHTMHKLLPPEVWFKEHPEYFALRNGIRMPDQACLSNPEVLEIVCKNLRKEIEANPKAKYWSVSQMDNFNFCECEKCRQIDSIEGSHSGTVIRFVNQVAERFPDKVISTLAYQYSRKAPLVIKPNENVNIMLCTIECNRNVPIAADTSEGSFYNDLRQWSALTNNILVWDYVINFSHLLAPFPNLHVLAPNLQLFADNGVKMMFEQGLRGTRGGEMNELRTYLLSKLMWDPYMDTDSLISDFVNGYYGIDAAPFILEYLALSESELHKSGKALTLYEPPSTHSSGYLSPDNLKKYFNLFEKAYQSTNDSVYKIRIDRARQSIRYAWLEVAKSVPFTDNWLFTSVPPYTLKEEIKQLLEDLTSISLKYGPEIYHEIRLTPKEYQQLMTDYFNNGIVRHKAVGKAVTYTDLPDPKYQANGMLSLIDGVTGTGSYQTLWQGWWGKNCEVTIDLGEMQSIQKVVIGYLDDNQSWIMAPASMELFVSNDGINFTKAGEQVNEKAGVKSAPYTGHLEYMSEKPELCKYIRVKVNNIGKLPAWRGVDADAWLFVDEIHIY